MPVSSGCPESPKAKCVGRPVGAWICEAAWMGWANAPTDTTAARTAPVIRRFTPRVSAGALRRLNRFEEFEPVPEWIERVEPPVALQRRLWFELHPGLLQVLPKLLEPRND